jgi:hypothetical protein
MILPLILDQNNALLARRAAAKVIHQTTRAAAVSATGAGIAAISAAAAAPKGCTTDSNRTWGSRTCKPAISTVDIQITAGCRSTYAAITVVGCPANARYRVRRSADRH